MNNKCSRVQAGAANICMQQEQEHARFQWGEGNKHDGKILNLVCDVVERLVHLHARRVPVMAKSNDDGAVLLTQDRLVYGVSRVEVREHVRHGRCL